MTDGQNLVKPGGVMVLQNRWKICKNHIVYYGIRKAPYTFKNSIRLSKSSLKILKQLDGAKTLSRKEINFEIKRLIKQGIVVPKEKYAKGADSLEEAAFCKTCVANDYLIPGLELDENGQCPMCASKRKLSDLKAVLPVVSTFPHNKKGRFDVALFYTGGKDSTFLLYYLARKLNLRVLALTWITEYMSDSALESIENAKKIFSNVCFRAKKIDEHNMKKIYARHFELAGNTCMCPSLAYVLFFEELVLEKVPYLVLGNEPVQMQNLLFNNISPLIAFNKKWQAAGRFFFNLGRILTFRKPLTGGRMQMYFTVRTLAKGTFWGKNAEGRYQNEQVINVHNALKEAPELIEPFAKAVRKSGRKGNMPELVHVDLADVSGGYKWGDIKTLLIKEAGWVDADAENKALHTSCKIEKCKEFTQFVRFREMKSRTIPFSAIELSLAVSGGNVPRETALKEIKESSGFFGCEKEYALMIEHTGLDGCGN